MIKIAKLTVIFLVVTGMAWMVVPSFAQEKIDQQPISASGEVVSVDAGTSTVVVKQLKGPDANAYENITIAVSPDTKILKGDAALKLSDLKAGDNVKVESTKDAAGVIKATSIAIAVMETIPVK